MTALNLIGRVLVDSVTNKSGGALAKGDVVIVDTSNDRAVTTTTSARSETTVGVVIEENGIANNATGRVQFGGYVSLVNVPASVTRGHYIETHTVAKQATGNSTRRSGSFGQFATGGTTPTAWLWGSTDQTASGSSGVTVLDYVQNVAGNTVISATTEGTAHTLITGTSQAYAAVATVIETYWPRVNFAAVAGTSVIWLLYDGATILGRLAVESNPSGGTLIKSFRGSYRLTPTAATHQYIVKAYRQNNNCSVDTGAGGTGVELPGYMMVSTA